jgi:ABC-2 type transport system ATP-binding protein
VALSGDVDDLLSSHRHLTGRRRDNGSLPATQKVIESSHVDRQSTLLVRTEEPILDPAWTVTPVTLDDLVLAYMRQARDTSARPVLEVAR